MIRQIKTFEVTCDLCPAKAIVHAHSYGDPELPKGWKKHAVHNCGMTGYSTTQDLCPGCQNHE